MSLSIKNIPSDWELKKLKEVVDIFDNLRVPLSSEVRSRMKGKYPYCGANGIVGYINDWKFEGEYVLIAEDGGNFYDYKSRPITYLMNGKFWVNNHAHVLKAKNGLHLFLHYSLQHKNIIKYIIGSTRAKLNKSALESIKIPIPPLKEQQKIAEILSTVDAKISIIDEQISETQNLKKGLMQSLLSKGIGHTEFKKSALGEIPKSWEVKEINEVTSYVDYRGKTPPKVKEGILLVTAKNIKMGRIDYETSKEYIPKELYDEVMSRGIPKIGDILITTEAPLGNVASVDKENIALAQRVIKYRSNDNILYDNYLKYYMLSPLFQLLLEKESTGSTVKGIKGSRLHKLKVLIPPLKEQEKIASILNSVDEKLGVLSEKKSYYQNLKKGLMQQLLTGLVRVSV